MIEDGGVQPEGCICEPCSDISTNWRDMRSGFGYTTLYAISGVIQMSNLKSIYRGGFKCGICGLFS